MQFPLSRETLSWVKTIALTFLTTVVVVQALIIIGLSNVPENNVIAHSSGGIVWDSTNVLIFDSTVEVVGSTVDLHGSVVHWGQSNVMKDAECIPIKPPNRS